LRSRVSRPSGTLGAALACAALLWQTPAVAHLGGDVDSVGADRAALHADVQTMALLRYDIHQISTDAGTRVREYVTRRGTVFAVTWQGPLPPDLQQLFGSYYAAYRAALSAHARAGMHRQVAVAAGDLVVQVSARPRSFGGRAYVPSLVPAGVDAGTLP